ncbi:hypothetical protein J4G48_0045005 [Bradyrhizobium barranii subsp. apii]|uniref:DUF6731 family protein n=1 Tax=Bradyrhizobium barranii TaxID=2992140 RepID=UPI001AA1493D|nr:DUF6731 family protein [Bradyrhizobium barranii]UPT96123.1 hypothetical protein J4G48_0045005 [Bradyrhizobium barranii subsp. apii]
MDKGISIRYYRVERAEQHHSTFAATLQTIAALGAPGKRMREHNGMKIRLERFATPAAKIFEGEFVRLQETDYPSEVHENSVAALQTALPLGHHVAFVYDENRHVLAAQYDPRTLSLSRVNGYISCFPPHTWYLFTPLVRKDT